MDKRDEIREYARRMVAKKKRPLIAFDNIEESFKNKGDFTKLEAELLFHWIGKTAINKEAYLNNGTIRKILEDTFDDRVDIVLEKINKDRRLVVKQNYDIVNYNSLLNYRYDEWFLTSLLIADGDELTDFANAFVESLQ